MTNSKYFFLNGQEYFINFDLNLVEIVNYFNWNKTLIVIEYNNQICNKKNWNHIYINNNDIIEIVTIVGGG